MGRVFCPVFCPVSPLTSHYLSDCWLVTPRRCRLHHCLKAAPGCTCLSNLLVSDQRWGHCAFHHLQLENPSYLACQWLCECSERPSVLPRRAPCLWISVITWAWALLLQEISYGFSLIFDWCCYIWIAPCELTPKTIFFTLLQKHFQKSKPVCASVQLPVTFTF